MDAQNFNKFQEEAKTETAPRKMSKNVIFQDASDIFYITFQFYEGICSIGTASGRNRSGLVTQSCKRSETRRPPDIRNPKMKTGLGWGT